MTNIKIFSGSSNISLAEKIVANIGLNLSAINLKKFSNNEISVRLEESVRGHDVYLVQTGSGGVNSHLMELLIIINAAKYASAGRITAVLPYLPYSRQTKKDVSRVPITAKLVANMLCSAGVGHVITMHLHAIQSQGFFDVPVDNLSADNYQVTWIKHNIENWTQMSLFCLSTCCNERVSLLATVLQVPLGLIHVQRLTDSEQKLIVMGDVASRPAVLLLDIVDRCEPICAAAERLVEAGASKVYVIGTHGLMDEEMVLEIHSSVISHLVVTNTICQKKFLKLSDKLTCLDVSEIFAEAIRRSHHGESVSCLSSSLSK